jgi:2-succinyl-5-enolpyruvyl-6-hydroxy-3-cyclohexene-1-carboxylate synthase
VPLVVLSADRPAELRGTGANQTTVQPGIFGRAVRWEVDLPAPGAVDDAAGAFWRTTVCRALAAAGGRTDPYGGGPVHVNVGLRDPLAPDLADGDAGPGGGDVAGSGGLAGREDGGPWTRVETVPGVAGRPVDPDGESAGRTLVLLGDLPDPALARRALRWAEDAGWPVLAEPFGVLPVGGTVVPHGVLLAARLAAGDPELESRLAPDRVLVVGRLTLFRELGALLRRPGTVVEQVSPAAAWTDPSHVVGRVHGAGVLGVPPARADGWQGWVDAWVGAGRALTSGVRAATHGATGPAVAAAVAAALGEDDVLVLGSSNAPRDLALAHDGTGAAARVIASRGLAGIDGTVSTAVGVALTTPGRTVALMGDLTFLHDTNGLLVGPTEPVPDLTVVVVDDDGGGIFATLEYGEPARSATPGAAAATERLFGTPHGTDLAALCAAHGVEHRRVGSPHDLARALAEPVDGVRVLVVPVDRTAHRALRDRVRALRG